MSSNPYLGPSAALSVIAAALALIIFGLLIALAVISSPAPAPAPAQVAQPAFTTAPCP